MPIANYFGGIRQVGERPAPKFRREEFSPELLDIERVAWRLVLPRSLGAQVFHVFVERRVEADC